MTEGGTDPCDDHRYHGGEPRMCSTSSWHTWLTGTAAFAHGGWTGWVAAWCCTVPFSSGC